MIEGVYERFGQLDPYSVAEWTDDLPEWRKSDPFNGGSGAANILNKLLSATASMGNSLSRSLVPVLVVAHPQKVATTSDELVTAYSHPILVENILQYLGKNADDIKAIEAEAEWENYLSKYL